MNRPDTAAALSPPWGRYELPLGPARGVPFGPRTLWIRRRDGEIWLALANTGGAPASPENEGEAPPPELPWSRWASPGGESEVILRPCFPNRTLVLEPERPFRLLPGSEARVYVRVPLWVRVELPLLAATRAALTLDELPILPLSDTWWGDLQHGELAYWLTTTARREMRPELFAPHLAVCPIRMINRADEDLRVEKLALRVSHLSIFSAGGRLWADESRVTYLSEGEGTQIESAGEAPAEAPDGILVTPPRAVAARGMRARTFGILSGFGGTG